MSVIDKLKSDPPNALLLEEIIRGWGAPDEVAEEAGELFELMSEPVIDRKICPQAMIVALGFMAAYSINIIRETENDEAAEYAFELLQNTVRRIST